MKVLWALGAGFGRVIGSPSPVIVVWLAVLLVALPGGVVMEATIRADIGASLIHRDLREGLDLGWLEEFHRRNPGLGEALTPATVSSVAAFDNLERWFSGEWLTGHRGLAAWGAGFVVVWILLQGGVLDHLTRPRPRFELAAFFASSGTYFLPFLRVALLTGFGYFGVYRFARWLFPKIETLTRDVTAETTVMAGHLAGAAAVLFLMALVHLVADYAKIAAVRERRRSMLLATLRALRLVVAHPLQAFGLYSAVCLLLVVAQGSYFFFAPDLMGSSTASIVSAFLVGQLYLGIRWFLRLGLYGAEVQLFDRWTRRLATGMERYG